MPETKQIPTETILTISGSFIEIFTFYNEGLPNTLDAFISDEVGTKNLVSYIEGHLIITMKNYPDEIDYHIDSQGHLIVVADDANNYSIVNDGNLRYTF